MKKRRELSPAEMKLVEDADALERAAKKLHFAVIGSTREAMDAYGGSATWVYHESFRWASEGMTQIQQGCMSIKRAIGRDL